MDSWDAVLAERYRHDGRDVVALWRLARGYSQRELAQRAGVSRGTIERIEASRGTATVATLRRIATALDVDLASLLIENPVERERPDG